MATAKSTTFQTIRFALVGLLSAGIHLGVAQISLAQTGPFMANLIGFVTAFCFSWAGHFWFTFQQKAARGQSFRRYGIIALCGFAANNVILASLVNTQAVSQTWALTIAILIIPIISYIASTFWAFSAK